MKKQIDRKILRIDRNKKNSLETVIAMTLAVDLIEQKGSTITVHCPSMSDADDLNRELLDRYTEQFTDNFRSITEENRKPQLHLIK